MRKLSFPQLFLSCLSATALVALPACGDSGSDESQSAGDGDAVLAGDGDEAVAPECYDNTGCADGQECSGGFCLATQGCETEVDCSTSASCVEGVCRAMCLDDLACPGLRCDVVAGVCVPLENPDPVPGSGGSGGTDANGTGSTGSGGVADPEPPADPTYDVIDDFEDGDVDILPSSGRVGFWYTYNETSGGADSQASARPLASNPQMNEGSTAIHAAGTHLTGNEDEAYGGIGVDLNNTNGDGFQSRSSSRKVFDASAWDGVQFRVRSTGQDKSIRFEVVTSAISSGPGGNCSAGGEGQGCWDAYGRDVSLTSTWTTVKIPFSSLVQEGWGKSTIFSAAEILGFAWEDLNTSAWDFWLDDVEFYKDPPDDGGGGGTTPPMSCGDSWGDQSNGSVTWYTFDQGTDGFGDVNCSFGITTGSGGNGDKVNNVNTGAGTYFAAINTADYNQAATCGACVEVTRDGGPSVVATVVDQCPIDINPKCVKGHIDLSKAAFLQLGTEVEGYIGQRAGNGSITWKYVSCPTAGNVKFRLKEATNSDWNQVIVENHQYPIKSVQVKVDGTWVNASREPYNFWIPPGGRFGSSPYEIRATDINGNDLEGSVALSAGSQDSGKQFVCQ